MFDSLGKRIDLAGFVPGADTVSHRDNDTSTSRWREHLLGVTAALAALLMRGLFDPLLGDSSTFLIPLMAVITIAWRSGLTPALVTLLLSTVGICFLFLPPRQSLVVERRSDQVATGLFLVGGLACALLGEAQRRAGRSARHNLRTSLDRQAELEGEAARRRATENLLEQRAVQLTRAEQQTAEAFALLDTFVMNAPIGMAFCDRDLRYVRVNHSLAEANRLPIEAHLGKTPVEVQPDFPPSLLEDFHHVLDTGSPVLNRRIVRAAAGGEGAHTWEVSLYPVCQSAGAIIGVGMLARDITPSLRAMQQLRESEARFRRLAELVPQIVWVTRADGYHDYHNQRWYDYTGLSAQESLGDGWTVPVHPEDRTEAHESWQRAIASGNPYETEYRLRGHDGTYRWFLAKAVPYLDEEGQIVRWFGTCTDIDEQRRHTQTLERLVEQRTTELLSANAALRAEIDERRRAEVTALAMTRELQRSNAELEQFAYVASHDLQEPLRKIQAFGDRLQLRCRAQLSEQGQEYIDRMLSSASRMRRLIDDLLTFSRVSTSPQHLASVDLTAVVRDVLADLEERIDRTQGTIDVGPLPGIDADRSQMRQLFQNLIGNALKFHRRDVPPVVRIRGEVLPVGTNASGQAETVCRITVEDNGIGFDEKYLDRIFQVFQRLHGREEYEGTGVGLAICRKIVERHGGSIHANSQPGSGTTFVVVLPVRQREREHHAIEADHHPHGRR